MLEFMLRPTVAVCEFRLLYSSLRPLASWLKALSDGCLAYAEVRASDARRFMKRPPLGAPLQGSWSGTDQVVKLQVQARSSQSPRPAAAA